METKLLTISGGPRKTFEEAFWSGVTHTSTEGHPLRGSVGAAWAPQEDLKKFTSPGDLKGIGKEAGVSAQALAQLRMFLAFCDEDDSSLFFVRRGIHVLWLVRKVSGYFFQPDPANPHWGCHRVAFEFVRPATAAEGAPHKALGFRTLAWMQMPIADADADALEPKLSSHPFRAEEEMLTNGKVKQKRAPKATTEPIVATEPTVATTEPKAKRKATGAGAGAGTVQTLEQVMEKAGKPLELAPAIGPITASAGAGAGAGAIEMPITAYTKPASTPLHPTLLEAPEAPLSVERVEVVKVRLFEHSGLTYYREPTKNKLYKRQANGSIGPYLGRWNPRLKTVDLTVSDTDGEHD
jgi:hypothetical protein